MLECLYNTKIIIIKYKLRNITNYGKINDTSSTNKNNFKLLLLLLSLLFYCSFVH